MLICTFTPPSNTSSSNFMKTIPHVSMHAKVYVHGVELIEGNTSISEFSKTL